MAVLLVLCGRKEGGSQGYFKGLRAFPYRSTVPGGGQMEGGKYLGIKPIIKHESRADLTPLFQNK